MATGRGKDPPREPAVPRGCERFGRTPRADTTVLPSGVGNQGASRMSLMEIASRAGVPLEDIESLIRGNVSTRIASRLGVPMLGLEDFILRGFASASMARLLGISMSAAEDLARAIGSEGAIGIVLGLLLSSSSGESKTPTAIPTASNPPRGEHA